MPVDDVDQIICVGLNYHDHAEEQDEDIPENPMLFGKSPTTVTDPGAPIIHPDDVEQVDYEVELGIVIGRTADSVDAEDADVHRGLHCHRRRERPRRPVRRRAVLPRQELRYVRADGTSADESRRVDPNDLEATLRLNGETKQDSTTAEFIFDVGEVVEYISNVTTLRPGTVISTGTPGGVGIFRDPPELLSPGDTVEAEIEASARSRITSSASKFES